MANTNFTFAEKHINNWNKYTAEVAQLEDKLIVLKNNEEWIRAYQYFSNLATKGIVAQRPVKANGYTIGTILKDDFVCAKQHLATLLKLAPQIVEVENRLDALKNGDWGRAKHYFSVLYTRGVIQSKPLKRNGYKLDLTLTDAYTNKPQKERKKEIIMEMEKSDFFKGKGVRCTTDNRNFISCVEAGATYHISPSYIGQACNGKVKEIRGKHFCWLEDKDTFVPQPKEIKRKCGPAPKAVRCLTDGKEFPSVRETAQSYGIPQSCVSDVCNGKQKKTHGLSFCFISEMGKFADDIAKANAPAPVRVKIRLHRKGVR